MPDPEDFDDPSTNEEPPRPGYDLSRTEIQECDNVYKIIKKAEKEDREAILSQLIDAYKRDRLHTHLQFNKELTLDELKVYYLSLREYFAPKTNHTIFETKKQLVIHLRKCILNIRKKRKSWKGHTHAREGYYIGDDNKWYEGTIDPTTPHVYDTKFLSTNENNLHGLLSNIEDKGLIKRLPRQRELQHYEKEFPDLATKKHTWKLETFQPAENEYESPVDKTSLRHKSAVVVFSTPLQERIHLIGNMLRDEGDNYPL